MKFNERFGEVLSAVAIQICLYINSTSSIMAKRREDSCLAAAKTSDRPNLLAIYHGKHHGKLLKKRHVMSRSENTTAMSSW